MSGIFILQKQQQETPHFLQFIYVLTIVSSQEISTKYDKSKLRLKEKFETKNLDLENEVKFLRV